MSDQTVSVPPAYAVGVPAAPAMAGYGQYGQAVPAHGPVGKPRGAGAVILLGIVTLGIYSLVWQYKTFKEMKDFSGRGMGGGMALLLAILFAVVNVFAMPAEVGNLYALEGREKPVSGATGLWILLPLVGGIIWLVKTQGALNRYWRSHGAA